MINSCGFTKFLNITTVQTKARAKGTWRRLQSSFCNQKAKKQKHFLSCFTVLATIIRFNYHHLNSLFCLSKTENSHCFSNSVVFLVFGQVCPFLLHNQIFELHNNLTSAFENFLSGTATGVSEEMFSSASITKSMVTTSA